MGQDEKLPSAPAPQSLPQPLDRGVAAIEDESTVDPTNETAAKGTTPAAGEDERKFLAGMQMWLVASSLTTASFLVLLDNAIVATVCFPIAYFALRADYPSHNYALTRITPRTPL